MLEIIIVAVCIFADQLTKYLIEMWLLATSNGTVPIIKDVLYFTYARNYGAAFSIMQNMKVFFIVITLIASIGIIYMLIKNRKGNLLFRISLAITLGGAIGNLVDRIRIGYVIDFIDVRAINFAIFNVADACLVVGLMLLGIYYFFIEGKQERVAKKQLKESKTASNE